MKITNRIALFGWVFSLCFLTACALFTYILFRDGPANIRVNAPYDMRVYPEWLIPTVLSFFWLCGIATLASVAAKPLVSIERLGNGALRIVERYPLRRTVRDIAVRDLAPTTLVEAPDSDGDAYFRLCLTLPDGTEIDIAEGHDRAHCETAQARFQALCGLPGTGAA